VGANDHCADLPRRAAPTGVGKVDQFREAVRAAKDAGHSWREIGEVLGADDPHLWATSLFVEVAALGYERT
jgi:hypothetical protein